MDLNIIVELMNNKMYRNIISAINYLLVNSNQCGGQFIFSFKDFQFSQFFQYY